MSGYLVIWQMDIDADSPEEAARQALAYQRDPESTATVFDVESDAGTVRVDLTEGTTTPLAREPR